MRTRSYKRSAFFAALMTLAPVVSWAGLQGAPEGETRVKVGDKAPLENEELRAAQREGKMIVLMFGNTWHCIHCERTAFNIRDLLPAYGDSVAFILIEARDVKFWQAPDENKKLAERYGVIGEPWVFLIDSSGIVRHIFKGFTERPKIEAELSRMARKKKDLGASGAKQSGS